MVSLEKTMFFLPVKYKIIDNKVYVSFNLLVIPIDMTITKMILNIPLSKAQQGSIVTIRKVASNWNERNLSEGKFPAVTNVLHESKITGKESELVVDLTIFKDSWHKVGRKNYGIVIIFNKIRDKIFLEENSPYLIVETL